MKVGGAADDCHLLAKFRPTIAVSDMLGLIKTNASKWVNERSDVNQKFQWQPGFAAFSVSEPQFPKVSRYIENQEEHHRAKSFEEEFLEMLDRHSINYDLKYVFEQEIIE